MRKQLKSFGCALRGIGRTILSQSHMRFHIVATIYVIVFSFFYSFSAAQIALLAILIGLVMAFEILNTCLEELCNFVADRYEPVVRTVKDGAAGAVLVMSLAAVIVAFVFFFDIDRIWCIVMFFAHNPLMLALLIVSAVISVLFIIKGLVPLRHIFKK